MTESFKIVGYFPDWETEKIGLIRFDIMTHIIYAFAIPNIDGTLKELDHPQNAKSLIRLAHEKGVKVLVAVGGWSYEDIPLEPVFKEATKTQTKISNLVLEIMQMVNEYGFDGVDIDWEHPRAGEKSQQQYESLMLALRKKLDKEGKILTSAVMAGVEPEGEIMPDAAAHSDAVLNAVDWINVMAYDGGDGVRHSTYEFAINCANYWKETRGTAANKVVLGVPFYGRPTWKSYEGILKCDPNAYKSDIICIHNTDVYYNGVDTIKRKAEYCRKNLGGIMAWELSQDIADEEKSLVAALK